MKTTPIDERISALADNELSGFEVRRVARELIENEPRRDSWSRYQLIGDIMRDSEPAAFDSGFADAVMAKINDEPEFAEPATDKPAAAQAVSSGNAWGKPLLGLAIAASVAVVSVFTLKTLTNDSEPGMSAVPMAQTESPAINPQARAIPVSVTESVAVGAQNSMGIAQPQAKPIDSVIVDPSFNSYLSTHAEFAAQPSLKPQVRVVGFGQEAEK